MVSSLFLLSVGLAHAAVLPRQNLLPNETSTQRFSLPDSQDISSREAQISDTRSGFQYGPDVVAPRGAYFPAGSLAQKMINFDEDVYFAEQLPWVNKCEADAQSAAVAVASSGGLKTLDDYKKFYDGFQNTVPGGPYAGMLSNGTSDLLFSMERLSTAPFGIRRLKPDEALPFDLPVNVSMKQCGKSHTDLQKSGSLFYVDHRNLAQLPLTDGRYAAATDAYFYINPQNQDFLPLAIRTNRGSNLTYTPSDSPTDWLFAKLAFNMNDLWYQQWFHLERTHYLADLVFMAAVRSLSQDHPVYGLLDRLAYQTFAFRLSAVLTLINKGGPVDKLFFSNSSSAASYAIDLYNKGSAGDWTNIEFTTDLRNRGLIDCTYGPKLKHNPYHEDASIVNTAIDKFMTTFVHSYYASDAAVASDTELQAFVAEATPAKIINFPTSISTRQQLVDLLRHYAMTTGPIHSITNSNEPVKSTAVLPYHPMAFYQPLPTAKGLQDITPFMPNLTQSAAQITLLAAFNRPFITQGNPEGENRTLLHMFDLPDFLQRANNQTRSANEVFKASMADFSKKVQARGFDEHGLSQGMPFVWKVLDPNSTPFYLAV